MADIAGVLEEIRSELPQEVNLVAVSKFHPAEMVEEAYRAGQRIFGENRPQEMTAKQAVLPGDIHWHMIGHLQTNKVKMIVPYVSMIESVDTEKLLREINRQAQNSGRVIPVLLEIHVAAEETKSGFTPEEARTLIGNGTLEQLPNVRLSGLMCMASHTDDETRIHEDFGKVNRLFEELKNQYFISDPEFQYRSWGMSDDYKIAIAEGSNIVRIGTRIFGQRDYSKA